MSLTSKIDIRNESVPLNVALLAVKWLVTRVRYIGASELLRNKELF